VTGRIASGGGRAHHSGRRATAANDAIEHLVYATGDRRGPRSDLDTRNGGRSRTSGVARSRTLAFVDRLEGDRGLSTVLASQPGSVATSTCRVPTPTSILRKTFANWKATLKEPMRDVLNELERFSTQGRVWGERWSPVFGVRHPDRGRPCWAPNWSLCRIDFEPSRKCRVAGDRPGDRAGHSSPGQFA
jgi:hypothetical protein